MRASFHRHRASKVSSATAQHGHVTETSPSVAVMPPDARVQRMQALADRSKPVVQLHRTQALLNRHATSLPVQRMRISNGFHTHKVNPLELSSEQAMVIATQLPEDEFSTFELKADLPLIGNVMIEVLPEDVENIAYRAGLWRNREVAEESDDDHGGFNDDATEYNIDWSELTESGIQRLPKLVLFKVFYNLVQFHCKKANAEIPSEMEQRFEFWLKGGVYTRSMFKKLIGITSDTSDNTDQIVQMARSGNTYSYNTDYTGPGTGKDYEHVIYYRDSVGNIDFTKHPKHTVKGYNKFSGEKLKPGEIKWTYPQIDNSEVQMSTDLKNKKEGVMPSGKKVNLPKASRSQHFAIADMLYPNSRAGKWTWHHLNKEYKMVLVDMKVHAKHGHNGGVYLWK